MIRTQLFATVVKMRALLFKQPRRNLRSATKELNIGKGHAVRTILNKKNELSKNASSFRSRLFDEITDAFVNGHFHFVRRHPMALDDRL